MKPATGSGDGCAMPGQVEKVNSWERWCWCWWWLWWRWWRWWWTAEKDGVSVGYGYGYGDSDGDGDGEQLRRCWDVRGCVMPGQLGKTDRLWWRKNLDESSEDQKQFVPRKRFPDAVALAWFEKYFFCGDWDLSTNSKGKKSFIADEASFFVKKPFWFEFIGFFPMVRVPDQGGEVKRVNAAVTLWCWRISFVYFTSWCSKALRRQRCPWESWNPSLKK